MLSGLVQVMSYFIPAKHASFVVGTQQTFSHGSIGRFLTRLDYGGESKIDERENHRESAIHNRMAAALGLPITNYLQKIEDFNVTLLG